MFAMIRIVPNRVLKFLDVRRCDSGPGGSSVATKRSFQTVVLAGRATPSTFLLILNVFV